MANCRMVFFYLGKIKSLNEDSYINPHSLSMKIKMRQRSDFGLKKQ